MFLRTAHLTRSVLLCALFTSSVYAEGTEVATTDSPNQGGSDLERLEDQRLQKEILLSQYPHELAEHYLYLLPWASGIARRKGGKAVRYEDAEDIGVIAFNEAVKKYEPRKGSFKRILHTIVIRKTVDFTRLRKNYYPPLSLDRLISDTKDSARENKKEDNALFLEDNFVGSRLSWDDIEAAAIRMQGNDFRNNLNIFKLYHVHGHSYKKIMEITGIKKVGTVKSRMSRCLDVLRSIALPVDGLS
jgi:RNA polymerase sigma factor (sigma-70 family)